MALGGFWCPEPDRSLLFFFWSKFVQNIKLKLKGPLPPLILSCSLNSCLNGFALGEEIFSIGGREEKKNLQEEKGIIVLILLPAVILKQGVLEPEMASRLPIPS